jgi:hypothetical protein
MKKISLGQTVQIVANLGVVVGILLLAYELRQNSAASRLEAAQAHIEIAHQLDLLMASDADLVEVLFAGPEGEDEMGRFRWQRFAFALLRSWENGHYLHSVGALDDQLWEAQTNLISEALESTPTIQQYWRDNKHVYSVRFNDFVERILEEGTP